MIWLEPHEPPDHDQGEIIWLNFRLTQYVYSHSQQ